MSNYNIVATTATEKYNIIEAIRNSGAVLTGVSGYGSGYYIQLNATEDQADQINKIISEVQ